MNNRILLISLFGLFIILNLVPTYLWTWGISLIDLGRPEFSTIKFETREILDSIIRYTILIGLWLPILIVILRRKWKPKALILPIVISLILFVVMIKSQDVYPDEYSEYTENGYQHRIEKWDEKEETKIRYWKSRDSLTNYMTHRHIEWELLKEENK